MSKFIQLSEQDCQYLLELIEELDSDTEYTKEQRGITKPKLETILQNPRSTKLNYPDVEYLLNLVDDDDLEEDEPQREAAYKSLLAIQQLQQERFQKNIEIEQQREQRRNRRMERSNG